MRRRHFLAAAAAAILVLETYLGVHRRPLAPAHAQYCALGRLT